MAQAAYSHDSDRLSRDAYVPHGIAYVPVRRSGARRHRRTDAHRGGPGQWERIDQSIERLYGRRRGHHGYM